MKCHTCEAEARAICKFCGRAVCKEHTKTGDYFSGFGQKLKEHLWPSGSNTGVIVKDAIWCGECNVEFQRTY